MGRLANDCFAPEADIPSRSAFDPTATLVAPGGSALDAGFRPCPGPLQGRVARVLAAPPGASFRNFKLREGVKFSDATASPSGALFWNRMVTCTDSSSRDVLNRTNRAGFTM